MLPAQSVFVSSRFQFRVRFYRGLSVDQVTRHIGLSLPGPCLRCDDVPAFSSALPAPSCLRSNTPLGRSNSAHQNARLHAQVRAGVAANDSLVVPVLDVGNADLSNNIQARDSLLDPFACAPFEFVRSCLPIVPASAFGFHSCVNPAAAGQIAGSLCVVQFAAPQLVGSYAMAVVVTSPGRAPEFVQGASQSLPPYRWTSSRSFLSTSAASIAPCQSCAVL